MSGMTVGGREAASCETDWSSGISRRRLLATGGAAVVGGILLGLPSAAGAASATEPVLGLPGLDAEQRDALRAIIGALDGSSYFLVDASEAESAVEYVDQLYRRGTESFREYVAAALAQSDVGGGQRDSSDRLARLRARFGSKSPGVVGGASAIVYVGCLAFYKPGGLVRFDPAMVP